jgi:hypothetical protein
MVAIVLSSQEKIITSKFSRPLQPMKPNVWTRSLKAC